MEKAWEYYRNFPRHYKIILLLLLMGAVGGMSYVEQVQPAIDELEAARIEDETLTSEVGSMSKSGQTLVTVEAEMRKLDDELNSMLESLPPEPEFEKILGSMASVAKETAIELVQFTPDEKSLKSSSEQPEAAPGGAAPAPGAPPPPNEMQQGAAQPTGVPTARPLEAVRPVTFKIELAGQFSQIVTFFDRVLNLPRVIRLDSFSIRTDRPNKLVPYQKLFVEATFIAYTQRQSEVFGARLAKADTGAASEVKGTTNQSADMPPAPLPGAGSAAQPAEGLSAKPLGDTK